jgi:hypothetical protein
MLQLGKHRDALASARQIGFQSTMLFVGARKLAPQ